MTDSTCYTCKYINSNPSNHCRRYPPQIYIYSYGGDQIDTMHCFPDVADSDWCGEWAAKAKGEMKQ